MLTTRRASSARGRHSVSDRRLLVMRIVTLNSKMLLVRGRKFNTGNYFGMESARLILDSRGYGFSICMLLEKISSRLLIFAILIF